MKNKEKNEEKWCEKKGLFFGNKSLTLHQPCLAAWKIYTYEVYTVHPSEGGGACFLASWGLNSGHQTPRNITAVYGSEGFKGGGGNWPPTYAERRKPISGSRGYFFQSALHAFPSKEIYQGVYIYIY